MALALIGGLIVVLVSAIIYFKIVVKNAWQTGWNVL
jgi:hypothetical protein